MKPYAPHLRKFSWFTTALLFLGVILLETMPGLKIGAYSLLYDGDDLQAYRAEIVEYRIKSRLFPRNPYFHCELGVLLATHLSLESERRERLPEAIAAFETCIKLDKKNECAYYWLGNLYCNRLNNPKRGIAYLQKAVQIAPLGYRNQLDLAYAYKQVGDKEKAQYHWRLANALTNQEVSEGGSPVDSGIAVQ